MHYQIFAWLFAGIALFVGIAIFVIGDRWLTRRRRFHRRNEKDDRYQCKLSANKEYEAQQGRSHLA